MTCKLLVQSATDNDPRARLWVRELRQSPDGADGQVSSRELAPGEAVEVWVHGAQRVVVEEQGAG